MNEAGDGRLVVIVGSGPSGLAAAIELGRRSIPCLLIERNPHAGHAPRAKTTHTRTREHLRRWGIAGKLAEASPFGVDYPSHVVYVTRLGGELIVRLENALNCNPARDERYSEHSQWIPQYKLEAVLQTYADTLPLVRIEYGQELVGFEQDAAAVRITVRNVATGAERIVDADYLIGADGARSLVRDAIGARMVGTYGLSRNYNTIFRAPGLAEAHPHGPGIMYIQLNPDAPSLIGPMDQGDLWYFMPTMLAPGATLTAEQTLDMIRRSTGIDLPYEIISSDEWVASRLLADKYRDRRVFLSGDACHLHPPYGGYGMNMGVADSVDLGWKIAAILQGWGGPALLDSYELERRPAHEFVLDEAVANHASSPNELYRDGVEDAGEAGDAIRRAVAQRVVEFKQAEFYALGVVLGYRYEGSPIVIGDGSPAWERSRSYTPSAAPGCLAPHHWLADGASLYDLFGTGFTLLVLGNAARDDSAAAEVEAAKLGIPLTVVIRHEPELRALYQANLVLIRPDQHVAWRGDYWVTGAVLDVVTGRAPAYDWQTRRADTA